jgi:hypothetical protein
MSKIPATGKNEKTQVKAKKREDAPKPVNHALEHPTLSTLQNHLGNRAIQRLLAQRSGDGAFDLDDATAGRINRARGGGQALDTSIQAKMGESMGADFSGVRVHTGSESHALNEQLNAKAFTTGSDIFFRDGAYSPQSSGGQELLAHELTHVVQQSTGAVRGGGGGGSTMTVNAAGDRFEQEADSVAKSVTSTAAAPPVQRQMPEEEELQTKRLQRQEAEEDDLQMQAMPEEEEPVQMQAMPEEEQMTG